MMDFREILMIGTHVIIIPLPFTRSCILIAFSLVMETGRDSFLTGTVVLGFTNDPPNIDSFEPSEFGSSLFKEP